MTNALLPRSRGRRALVAATVAAPFVATWPRAALAGAQVEEPLADAVRSALAAAIADAAPPKPTFTDFYQKLAYLRWLGAMSDRLRRQKAELVTRIEFLQTLWYESKRAGLEPALLLGLVQVESNFRKYAISIAGARGYMQVMPFWVKLIGAAEQNLFHLRTNLRYGCAILRLYLDMQKGDYFRALGRYNGSLGQPEYPKAVLAAWRGRWKYDGPTA